MVHCNPWPPGLPLLTTTTAAAVVLVVMAAAGRVVAKQAGDGSDHPSRLYDTRPMHNVSKVIDSILDGYDIRLRPQFGRSSLGIDMELVLASFDSISEVNMDYTITIYLNQYWQDERLAFSKNGSHFMTLTGDFAEKIWVPDTFFANDKNSFLHDVTEKNKMVRLHGDGSITYGMRFTTTLACMMDLHHYPLDKQNCTVEIESYGYPMQDVIMRWKGDRKSITGVDSADIPQFSIIKYDISSAVEVLATGRYQRLSLSFTLRRNVGYFIFQTYLPSILIVMLSWVSFWINHEATSARVALGITTVLTMTTISTGVRSSLPRISYVKAIDIYLVMCFVFVFAALLEYAAVNYTYWGARAKRKAKRLKEQKRKFEKEYEDTIDIEEDLCEGTKRVSPLQGLRSQQTFNYGPSEIGRNNCSGTTLSEQPECSTQDFRISSQKSSQPRRRVLGVSAGGENNAFGGPFQRRRRVMATVRKHAKRIGQRLPTVKDVNKIDKYSRLFFPSLFIVFNVCYWCYYLLQE